jgi:hypothetical protein
VVVLANSPLLVLVFERAGSVATAAVVRVRSVVSRPHCAEEEPDGLVVLGVTLDAATPYPISPVSVATLAPNCVDNPGAANGFHNKLGKEDAAGVK